MDNKYSTTSTSYRLGTMESIVSSSQYKHKLFDVLTSIAYADTTRPLNIGSAENMGYPLPQSVWKPIHVS